MPYQLAIFDFDGTLANSLVWFKDILGELGQRFDFRAPLPEEIQGLRQLDGKALLSHLGIPLWKLPQIATHVRTLIARDAERIPMYPGATPMLAELEARGIVIAVVSSNAEENVRRILGPETAARVRHYACGAAMFGKRKKFRKVLQRASVAASDAIAIGDEVRDIDAAAAEGIDTAAVTWGYATPDVLRARGATYVVETFDELLLAITRDR